MSTVTAIALGGLGVSAGLCLVRVLLGRTIADRIVALDSVLIMVAGGIAVYSARIGSGEYLGLLFVIALMGFIGTVGVARFMERRQR